MPPLTADPYIGASRRAFGSNVGGARSTNPFVNKYDDEQREQQLARDAAREIIARRPRDMNGTAPWWRDYFDKVEENQLAANMQGKSFRMDFGGFGNATSQKQGGVTVARTSHSPFARPGSNQDDERMASDAALENVDRGLMRSQQLRAGDYALQGQADALARGARSEIEDSPDFQLGSGRAGARAQQMGDIGRDQFAQDTRQRARLYFDPTIKAQREAQVDDEERLLTARYGREADAQAKIEAARIAAGGRVGAAEATAGGAQTREFIRALMKARENAQLLGGDPTGNAAFEEELRGQIPGLDDLQGGIDDISLNAMIAAGRSGPGRQQLMSVWDQLSPEQQARVRQQLGRR